jgi:hypothetical protein
MYTLIKDPVEVFDPAEIGLSAVGVKIIEVDGVYHVFDWVGASHYPNAADFLEEAVRLGLSRRISKTADFEKLDSRSRLVLVHPKAYIEAPFTFFDDDDVPCPTGLHRIGRPLGEAGALWLVGDVGCTTERTNEKPFPEWAPCPSYESKGVRRRDMPAFDYLLRERRPDDPIKLWPGIIMIAPIERLAVVIDPNDQEATNAALDAAEASKIPVTLDEE